MSYRFFKVIEPAPELAAALLIDRQDQRDGADRRNAFLKSMGVTKCMTDRGFYGDATVICVEDPNPEKDPPRGWYRSVNKSEEGFIKPRSKGAKEKVGALKQTAFPKTQVYVRLLLKSLCPEAIPYGRDDSRSWDFNHRPDPSKPAKFGVGWAGVYDLDGHGLFISVPSHGLKFKELPGMEEVFEHVLDEALTAYNAEAKQK